MLKIRLIHKRYKLVPVTNDTRYNCCVNRSQTVKEALPAIWFTAMKHGLRLGIHSEFKRCQQIAMEEKKLN